MKETTMDMKSIIPWGRNGNMPQRWNDETVTSPFGALHRQMDRLFDDFFRDFGNTANRSGLAAWNGNWPHIELSESDTLVTVSAELPGMTEKDVEVTLADGVLSLKGEKRRETKDKVYSEIWHGSFERALAVGDVDPDKVNATFKDGVLTITLEKRPEAQAQTKRIAINKQH
jgi:HSP20 family protein